MSSLTAYLDTCIVSGLAKEDLGADELEALQRILEAKKRGKLSLVTSSVTQDEIEKIPKEHRYRHEIIYNLLSDVPVAKAFQIYSRSMMGLGMGMGMGAGTRRLYPMLAKLYKLLPGEADARHLYQAAKNEVQYFLTTDVRTILSHRTQIEDICQMKVLSPKEFQEILSEMEGKNT